MPRPLRAKRTATNRCRTRFVPAPPGYSHAISETNEQPDLDDVMTPTEGVHPDRREHSKDAKHLDDAELDRRIRHEREIVHGDSSASD
jgi:hypothetical protein